LATLYGEPNEHYTHYGHKDELIKRNRTTWNRYYSELLDQKKKDRLIQEKGFLEEELTRLTQEQLQDVKEAFATRVAAAERRCWLVEHRGYSEEDLTSFSLE
jgi:hypothetical protein